MYLYKIAKHLKTVAHNRRLCFLPTVLISLTILFNKYHCVEKSQSFFVLIRFSITTLTLFLVKHSKIQVWLCTEHRAMRVFTRVRVLFGGVNLLRNMILKINKTL